MKELSIEEKAKLYDEAIERAKAYQGLRSEMEIIFPELKESGDERMVKFIKNQLFNIKKTITDNYKLDTELTKAIDWLEKQGEQKPKFRVGDVIKCKYDDRQFTIKSVNLDKGTYIYTQEGYGNDIDYADEDFELVEQKPAWSEEDEKMFDYALNMIEWYGTVDKDKSKPVSDWLKSLKDRVQLQPKQEWSEEDEKMLNHIIRDLREFRNCETDEELISDYEDEINWLKFLRPQNRWKPSDEQMYNLSEAAHYDCAFFDMEILKVLYDDLKKLREE